MRVVTYIILKTIEVKGKKYVMYYVKSYWTSRIMLKFPFVELKKKIKRKDELIERDGCRVEITRLRYYISFFDSSC